jgi:tetratricopeptide (TPR) repeat protein
MSDELEKMFAEVISAVRQGQRSRAKDLLSRLLRADQSNAEYWVWMSAVVDSANERQYCLQQALKINPNHGPARRGLIMLGGLPADGVTPVAPQRRKWSAATEVIEEAPQKGMAGLWQKLPPFIRARPAMVGFIVVVLILCVSIGGLLWGALSHQGNGVPAGYNTVAPLAPIWDTNTPTPSLTPTATPLIRTATPTLSGKTPLAALLRTTYTPTPRYIATPHKISEAFLSGMQAYDKGEYEKMLQNMEQASTEMPSEPDVAFYRAEALRQLTRFEDALAIYDEIIENSPTFAPAYLGRALTLWALNESKDIAENLTTAIELDPEYLDARFQRAAYRLTQGDLDGSLEDLQEAENINPDYPMLYLLRAEIYLQMGESALALDNAQQAYELDRTILPAYLVLGKAYLANNQAQEAFQYIHDYLAYEKQDPEGLLAMGQVYYLLGKDFQTALEMLDQALALDKKLAEGYHYRGLTYLALDDAKSAVGDMVNAVRYAPKNFPIQLDMGIALFAAERNADAVNQLTAAFKLAETDAQRAAVYHWRAQIYQTAGNVPAAVKEWEALLALPAANVPSDWRAQASESLVALTPTPEITSTSTPDINTTQTITPTPGATATP